MALVLLPATQANAAIAAILAPGTTYFGSLHTATPGLTGANEVGGGSYARQALIYGSGVNGVESSTDAQNWTSMPSVTVTHYGNWSLVTGGTYLGGGLLTSSLTVPLGATVAAAIGGLTAAVQG